jgi:branched-chain amino acid transport system ATP-binding protein
MTKPLLHIEKLVKRFGGLTATDHANLSVAEGKIHALIGPNGAGKTTLIAQISGAMPSDSGRIFFAGHDITKLTMDERARLGLVRSYQITSIFGRLSVFDNIALAVQAIEGSSFRFWSSARSEKERYEKAQAVAQRVGLGKRLNQLAQALSHGEQRQLEVGLALASRPQLLLLDEPMAGMGPEETERMVGLLDSLRGETTVVLVEHDMDAVFKLADTISVLVFGKVIATGNAQEIKDNPSVKVAYLGDEFQHNNLPQVKP